MNKRLMNAKDAELIVKTSVLKRRRKDKRLKFYGRSTIFIALSFLFFLFYSIFEKGIPGFFQYYVTLDVTLDQKRLDPKGDLSPESLYNGDARGLVLESLYKVIKPKGRKEKKSAKKIISSNADVRVAKMILHDPSILGKTIPITFAVDDDIDITIEEKDLRIDTFRSSGAGGQHVNTTDSAVRITHLPTKIVVQCQNERSQHKNKETCYKMLRARLYEHELQKRKKESDNIESSKSEIGWGHQIRSYVLHPYRMVKDNRTNYENSNPDKVLDGDIDEFLENSLHKINA